MAQRIGKRAIISADGGGAWKSVARKHLGGFGSPMHPLKPVPLPIREGVPRRAGVVGTRTLPRPCWHPCLCPPGGARLATANHTKKQYVSVVRFRVRRSVAKRSAGATSKAPKRQRRTVVRRPAGRVLKKGKTGPGSRGGKADAQVAVKGGDNLAEAAFGAVKGQLRRTGAISSARTATETFMARAWGFRHPGWEGAALFFSALYPPSAHPLSCMPCNKYGFQGP